MITYRPVPAWQQVIGFVVGLLIGLGLLVAPGDLMEVVVQYTPVLLGVSLCVILTIQHARTGLLLAGACPVQRDRVAGDRVGATGDISSHGAAYRRVLWRDGAGVCGGWRVDAASLSADGSTSRRRRS